MGEGVIKNGQKNSDVFYGRLLSCYVNFVVNEYIEDLLNLLNLADFNTVGFFD